MERTLHKNYKALQESNNADWAVRSFRELSKSVLYSCQNIQSSHFNLSIAEIEDGVWKALNPVRYQEQKAKKVQEAHQKFMQAKALRLKGKIEGALQLAKKSADMGNSSALMLMGSIYQCDLKSFDQAFEFYSQAAARGASLGLAMVATCYFDGIGVDQNKSKAFEYFKQAQRRDLVLLNNYWLGKLYQEGSEGVEKNQAFATACFTQLKSLQWAVDFGRIKLKH